MNSKTPGPTGPKVRQLLTKVRTLALNSPLAKRLLANMKPLPAAAPVSPEDVRDLTPERALAMVEALDPAASWSFYAQLPVSTQEFIAGKVSTARWGSLLINEIQAQALASAKASTTPRAALEPAPAPALTVASAAPQFKVIVADNYHYQDESESYEYGAYPTLDAAIEVAKQIVDRDLADSFKPGMKADELFARYRGFGEDPYIRHPSITGMTPLPFSAWTYAEQRSAEVCARKPTEPSFPPEVWAAAQKEQDEYERDNACPVPQVWPVGD